MNKTIPKVNAAMTKKIVTIFWKSSIKRAWELMEKKQIRHLPVTDDNGNILGILSDRDVNRAMDPKLVYFSDEARVSDYMSWPILIVNKNDSLVHVLDIMIDQKISALLVTESEEVVGICTSEDMLRAFRQLLETGANHKNAKLSDLVFQPLLQEAIRTTGSIGL
ncbi:MAG: CBS domain-containing protein [Oligoflexia bacterium]|nr:CBS domain-containing protein [Oligoflexia bacterium]